TRPPRAETRAPLRSPLGLRTTRPGADSTEPGPRQPEPPPKRVAPPEQTGDGTLVPAVVVAAGRVGLAVLRRLRHALGERIGPPEQLPHLRWLFLDTDPDDAVAAANAAPGVTLTTDEILLARLNRPGHYLKPRKNGRSL